MRGEECWGEEWWCTDKQGVPREECLRLVPIGSDIKHVTAGVAWSEVNIHSNTFANLPNGKIQNWGRLQTYLEGVSISDLVGEGRYSVITAVYGQTRNLFYNCLITTSVIPLEESLQPTIDQNRNTYQWWCVVRMYLISTLCSLAAAISFAGSAGSFIAKISKKILKN